MTPPTAAELERLQLHIKLCAAAGNTKVPVSFALLERLIAVARGVRP